MVLILAASMVFAALDSSVRWLGPALPVLLMLWWRYATQAMVMAVWLALDRARGALVGIARIEGDRLLFEEPAMAGADGQRSR